jgi:hypothetical protein
LAAAFFFAAAAMTVALIDRNSLILTLESVVVDAKCERQRAARWVGGTSRSAAPRYGRRLARLCPS